jgi:hypothetical protein
MDLRLDGAQIRRIFDSSKGKTIALGRSGWTCGNSMQLQ